MREIQFKDVVRFCLEVRGVEIVRTSHIEQNTENGIPRIDRLRRDSGANLESDASAEPRSRAGERLMWFNEMLCSLLILFAFQANRWFHGKPLSDGMLTCVA